jgi:hypothetical protein
MDRRLRRYMSAWHTPHASSRTSTSPARGAPARPRSHSAVPRTPRAPQHASSSIVLLRPRLAVPSCARLSGLTGWPVTLAEQRIDISLRRRASRLPRSATCFTGAQAVLPLRWSRTRARSRRARTIRSFDYRTRGPFVVLRLDFVLERLYVLTVQASWLLCESSEEPHELARRRAHDQR